MRLIHGLDMRTLCLVLLFYHDYLLVLQDLGQGCKAVATPETHFVRMQTHQVGHAVGRVTAA